MGTAVRVKPGGVAPRLDQEIGDWRGRILGYEEDPSSGQQQINIQWDSLTLRNMPRTYIERCRKQRVSWQEITLPVNQVSRAGLRDREQDVAEAVEAIRQDLLIGPWIERGKQVQAKLRSLFKRGD